MTRSGRRFVRLSYLLRDGMPVYPGDPQVRARRHKTIAGNGSNVLEIAVGSHSATHLDAPFHVFAQGQGVTGLFPGQCLGVARCLRLKHPHCGKAAASWLRDVQAGEAVFIDTGHYRLWGKDAFFAGWPGVPADIIDLLVRRKVGAVGIDTPGIDAKGDRVKPNHRLLLGKKIAVYECMANLGALPEHEPFVYSAGPLLFDRSDGAPVSIFALVGDPALTRCVTAFKKGAGHAR